MSCATVTLLRNLAEREADAANFCARDTVPGHVNRAYHVGRCTAFRESVALIEGGVEGDERGLVAGPEASGGSGRDVWPRDGESEA